MRPGTSGYGTLAFTVSITDIDDLIVKVNQRLDGFGFDEAWYVEWEALVNPESEEFGGDIVTWRAQVSAIWRRQ